MDARTRQIALTTAMLIVLTCIMVGLAFARAQPGYQAARARWEQRQPRHYVMDATWRDGFGDARRVRIEVRDRVLVAGVDRTTGRPLSPLELAAAAKFVSVDALFEAIAVARRAPARWPDQVARALPPLAPWISPCVTPLPTVRYDPALGYPTSLDLRANPCTATFLYSVDMNIYIQIERLQPLP